MAKIIWGTFPNVDVTEPDFKVSPMQAAVLLVEETTDNTEIWLFEGATIITTDAIDDVEAALGGIGNLKVNWATFPNVAPLLNDFKVNPFAVSTLLEVKDDPDITVLVLASGQRIIADLPIDDVEDELEN